MSWFVSLFSDPSVADPSSWRVADLYSRFVKWQGRPPRCWVTAWASPPPYTWSRWSPGPGDIGGHEATSPRPPVPRPHMMPRPPITRSLENTTRMLSSLCDTWCENVMIPEKFSTNWLSVCSTQTSCDTIHQLTTRQSKLQSRSLSSCLKSKSVILDIVTLDQELRILFHHRKYKEWLMW